MRADTWQELTNRTVETLKQHFSAYMGSQPGALNVGEFYMTSHGGDRHGSWVWQWQTDRTDGVTRYALMSVTEVPEGGYPYVVEFAVGLDYSDGYYLRDPNVVRVTYGEEELLRAAGDEIPALLLATIARSRRLEVPLKGSETSGTYLFGENPLPPPPSWGAEAPQSR